MTRLDPKTPIMIAEWATGEFPPGSKAAWIRKGSNYFGRAILESRRQSIGTSAGRIRMKLQQPAGQFVGRIAQAYREGVAHPDWLGELLLRPIQIK